MISHILWIGCGIVGLCVLLYAMLYIAAIFTLFRFIITFSMAIFGINKDINKRNKNE